MNAADSPADETATRNARQRRWILAALMCTMMLAAMDTTIVSTAIPQIVGDLGGFTLFSWVFSIYLLAQTVTIPIYGKLSDLFGRKSVLLIGTVIFLSGSAASAASWSMPSLIVFRGFQGLGAGSIMATVTTLAGDLYSVRERAVIEGWLSSVWGMAAIIGPVLGGALAEYVSWRWIFLINVPIGVAAMALLGRFLHEHFERRRPRVDYAGSALLLATVGTFIFGLLEGGQAWGWASAPSLVVFASACVLLIALVWVERHAPEPVMPGWLWKDRALAGANLATIFMGVIMMAPGVYLPVFGQSVLGLGAIAAGLVLASESIGWPIASSLSGRLYMRIGFRDSALAGAVLLALAAAGFVALPDPMPVWLLVIDTICLGGGLGLLSTPLLVGVQSMVGWERRGVVTGANMFSRYLGSSLGAALMGAIFNAALRDRLHSAPASLTGSLPDRVNQVIGALTQGHLSADALAYLRGAIDAGVSHSYLAGAMLALLMVACVVMMPRHIEHRGRSFNGGAGRE